MSRMKCLATLRLLMTFPAATPILSGSLIRPAAARAAMAPRSASVAASSSWRVRARLAASNGLRQAISRSPGKSGELISARSCSSNRDSCSGPSSAMSFLIAGWRRQVIHAIPSSSRRSLIRAVVIIPRSPTMIIFSRANFCRTALTASGKAFGSAVLPANTRTATGRPSLSVEQPVLDLRLAALAVPGVAVGGQLAVRAFHPGATTGRTWRSRPRPGAGRRAASRCRPGALAASPSRRRCHRWTRPPRPGPGRGSRRPTSRQWTAWRRGG